ncbi:hypothetical protein PQY67_09200 [Pseudomonadales bacterium]|nr:hypothetical protein [Pseudomonadales bacterium]
MSHNIWVHRFNENELGLGGGVGRGSFCLVPVDARPIIDENDQRDESYFPNFTINVEFINAGFNGSLTYSRPRSKTEHRLSLSGLSAHIGDASSGKPIFPGETAVFFRKDERIICLLSKGADTYSVMLEQLAPAGRPNNLVANATILEARILNVEGLQPLPKPFLLLAGISGTGKTRFVREQARAHGLRDKNHEIVAVRPDWHEPSDLLGYVSRLGGTAKYISMPVLQFILDAWRAVYPDATDTELGNLKLDTPPYWLCLDEMNLAPVEQYFADYLSALESRAFSDAGYSCQALLGAKTLSSNDGDFQTDLGLDNETALWDFFCENGIGLPPNLIVAGTVNMDETTHGFSRKVIDRAISIDFGNFYPNDFKKYLDGEQDLPKVLTYSTKTHADIDSFECEVEKAAALTVDFLKAVNAVLTNTPFELAYRALNELLLFVECFAPSNAAELQAVWDDFLMTKVLPRIDGDEDKLRSIESDSNILEALEKVLSDQLKDIWKDGETRVDLLNVKADGSDIDDVACRSREKIEWMKRRLEKNTFTSYWP